MNEPIRFPFLILWVITAMCSANAAEYSEANDVPDITSLLFTPSTIAVTLEPHYTGGQVGETARTRYFIAKRTDYNFRQVPREEFSKLKESDHFQSHTNAYEVRDYKVTDSQDCSDSGYRSDTGSQDLTGRRNFQFLSESFEVRMLCRSSVADAVRLNGELWIATYQSGDHGEYGAEGVLVASNNREPAARIDVGYFPAQDIVTDPWSSDLWIVTGSQLTAVSEAKEVKSRYWPYHDFDLTRNRPDIFVVASDTRVKNNRLAILATWLGEASYEGLSQAHNSGVMLTDSLYNYAMFGNYFSHRPQFPVELASLLESAEPTHGWRKFACMSHGILAKTMCGLELDKWPTNSDWASVVVVREAPASPATPAPTWSGQFQLSYTLRRQHCPGSCEGNEPAATRQQ